MTTQRGVPAMEIHGRFYSASDGPETPVITRPWVFLCDEEEVGFHENIGSGGGVRRARTPPLAVPW